MKIRVEYMANGDPVTAEVLAEVIPRIGETVSFLGETTEYFYTVRDVVHTWSATPWQDEQSDLVLVDLGACVRRVPLVAHDD